MLHLMRKHAGSWMIKVVLGVIVVVFIFWGVGSYRAQRGNRIAVVNGTPIVLEEFRGVYDQLQEAYRRQFGDAFDEKVAHSLNIKGQALDQLINRRLLLLEANRLNLRVTDEELLRAIEQVPAFQRDGHFHPQVYQRVLSLNRMTPEIFEENTKHDLLIEKLQSFFLGSIKVSEAEALETHKWLEEEVSLDYVVFSASAYSNIETTTEEIETYFTNHKKIYEIPPEVKVQYLLFDFKGFEDQAKVSEEEVLTYFDINKDDYGTPKKVRARHILFKVEPGAEQEKIEEARKRAIDVLKKARSGTDFGKLAQKFSSDPGSRTKGGDLGYFAADRMVRPFSDVAFAMKPGEISEPVRTRFGWHIIKVEDIKEAKEPVLAEVSSEIRNKLLKDAARTLAFDRTEEIYEACYRASGISEVAEANKLKIQETGFFRRNGPVQGIKEGKQFAEAAFALAENEVSEPLELSDGYYIVELTAKKPASIPDLKTVEKKVRQDLIQSKKDDLAKKDAEKFLSSLKGGAEFQKAASDKKLNAKSTVFFKRSGAIPGIGLEREIQNAAFLLSTSKPLPDAVIKGRQGYYVIQFKARQEADPKKFEAKKSKVTSILLHRKRQGAIKDLLAQLREKAEITIEDGFLD